MTVHDSWTDKLSDYLDDELPDGERKAVAAHLAECPGCMSTLEELQRVAAAAAALAPIRPRDDLWSGIASRIGSASWTGGTGFAARAPRRFSFSLTELAAASLLLAALSGGAVAILMVRSGRFAAAPDRSAAAAPVAVAVTPDSPGLPVRCRGCRSGAGHGERLETDRWGDLLGGRAEPLDHRSRHRRSAQRARGRSVQRLSEWTSDGGTPAEARIAPARRGADGRAELARPEGRADKRCWDTPCSH